MINKVILLGNVGKDPEVNYIQPDVAVAKFPLATDESYKRKDGTWENRSNWHNIVAWRASAQYIEKNVRKGQLIYIEGKILTRKYEDKTGQERYITEIIANTIRILNKRDGSNSGMGSDFQNENQNIQDVNNQTYAKPNNIQAPQNDDPFTDNENDDDGLPF